MHDPDNRISSCLEHRNNYLQNSKVQGFEQISIPYELTWQTLHFKAYVSFYIVIYFVIKQRIKSVILLELRNEKEYIPHVSFKKSGKKKHFQNKAYLYLLPALTVAAAFCWYPSVKSIVESFLVVNQGGKVIGFAAFDNYRRLFSDQAFLHSIKVSVTFILLFVPANTFVTLLAASLTRRPSRLSFIPEYIFFTPVAVSLSAYSLLMSDIFRGEASVLNNLFSTAFSGITTPAGAMAVLVILGIFLDFGLDYILLMCAFRSIDRSVIEAARMDGAGGWRLYWCVEVPMIKNTVLVTIFLALKDALLISAPIIILTEGGPYRSTETIMFYYYTEAFRSGNRAVQNALASIVLLIAGAGMTVYSIFKRKKEAL